MGTMALERPGKFRWETLSPNHQIIIANGQYIWFYDVDLEQATVQNLKQHANSPALLLSGSTTALEERFKILECATKENDVSFRLAPRMNQDMVKEVLLKFAANKLKQMSVVDNLGQKTLFEFSQVKINPKLSRTLFQFHPPKNVDVIKQ